MQTAAIIALSALVVSVLIQVGGWLIFIGKTSARLEQLPTLVKKMEEAWRYIGRIDRRVAVLEDRDARAEAGD